jgi:Flp pilus assembly pilin Flp
MERIARWVSGRFGRLSPLKDREDGQAVTEYGIVLGVLMVLLATTVVALNTGIGTFLGKVTTKLSGLIT